MKEELQLFAASKRNFSKSFYRAAGCRQMLRLKKIDMNCGMNYTSFPLFQRISPYSRYTHSFNVACILHDFTGQPLIELAGLFHDIATPAFSHTIDFMNGDYLKQESTERGTEEIISSIDGIQDILADLNGSIKDVSNYHMYSIADNDSPRLSADRLEYSLSNIVNYGFASRKEVLKCYEDITVDANEEGQPEFVFTHQGTAVWFARHALMCSKVYAGDEDRYGMEYLARLLKKALEEKILKKDDLYTDDENAVAILMNSSMKEEWIAFTKLSSLQTSCKKPKGSGWLKADAKKRCIDPLWNGQRVSSFSKAFEKELNAFLSTRYDYWMKGDPSDE